MDFNPPCSIMELLSSLLSLDPVTIGLIPVVGLVLYYVLPFLIDRYKLIGYPGPFLAKFSSLWFARLAYNGINISEVHKWHENCGQSSPFSYAIACAD